MGPPQWASAVAQSGGARCGCRALGNQSVHSRVEEQLKRRIRVVWFSMMSETLGSNASTFQTFLLITVCSLPL